MWKDRVVQFWKELMGDNMMFFICFSLTSIFVSYWASSTQAYTFKPDFVVVEAIKLMIVWMELSGIPFQLREIKENSLCSIAFHLLAPLGK